MLSAAGKYLAATYSRHSFSETVSFSTFAFVWIVSKTHDISPVYGNSKILDLNNNPNNP